MKPLDLLVLVLVTEPNGDFAATTLTRTPTTAEILYSKNRPCTPPKTAYFNRLLDIITAAQPNTHSMKIARHKSLNLVLVED